MPEQPKVAERPDIEGLMKCAACPYAGVDIGTGEFHSFADALAYTLQLESSLRKVLTLAQESADVPARFERKIQDILREAGVKL